MSYTAQAIVGIHSYGFRGNENEISGYLSKEQPTASVQASDSTSGLYARLYSKQQEEVKMQTVHSLANAVRRASDLLASLDKKQFLAIAADIREKSREIESSFDGEHPHARMREHYRNDPFIADILAAELAENVSD